MALRFSAPLLFFTGVALYTTPISAESLSEPSPYLYEKPGDLYLGVIHPMGYNNFTHCHKHSRKLSTLSLAYLYAVSAVNKSPLLGNLSLGVYVGDSCSSELRGLAIAKRFRSLVSRERCNDQKAVVGVVGCVNSACSISVSRQLQLARIPQVSPLSTAAELGDRRKHPLFLRMVPSSIKMAAAIVGLLRHFNFSYLSVVYTDDSYGQSLFQEFKRQLELSEGPPLCFGLETTISGPEEAKKVSKFALVDGFRPFIPALYPCSFG